MAGKLRRDDIQEFVRFEVFKVFFFFPSLKHQNFYSSRWPGPEKMIISPRYDETLTAGS